jgi:hypothetical protein
MCHYKGLLQEYVMLCYVFLHTVAPFAMLRFPTHSGPLLHHVVQAVHTEYHIDRSHIQEPSPLNRAQHTTYSIPN